MKTKNEIISKIIELEEALETHRNNVHSGGSQNKDLVNEPLFNQAQSLRWACGFALDEELEEYGTVEKYNIPNIDMGFDNLIDDGICDSKKKTLTISNTNITQLDIAHRRNKI